MAAPFFSIEVRRGADDQVTKDFDIYEIYHEFMQIYPAYSVRKIEDELSWREVKKLMEISYIKISTNTRIDRIQIMVSKYLGITFEDKIQDDETLINTLKGLGWL